MMIVVVFLFTVAISLYIPQTRGFFNIGETGVYIAAITGGPFVGALAGGFGSMLADVFLGYTFYAPATLVIKGCEGLVVGYLSRRLEKLLRGRRAIYLSFPLGALVGALSFKLGSLFYVGVAEISVAFFTYTINITELVWATVSVVIGVAVIALTLWKNLYAGYVLSTSVGGILMITGYYVYEQFILGVYAIAEVPFNTMQVVIGMILSLSILGTLDKALRILSTD